MEAVLRTHEAELLGSRARSPSHTRTRIRARTRSPTRTRRRSRSRTRSRSPPRRPCSRFPRVGGRGEKGGEQEGAAKNVR